MKRQRCRICKVETIVDKSRRCRCCAEARMAQELGISYGVLKARIYERFGEQWSTAPGDALPRCAECGKVFFPGRAGQKFCSPACGKKHKNRDYYKRRKQRDAGQRAPVKSKRRNHGANTAVEDSGRADENKPVPKSKEI